MKKIYFNLQVIFFCVFQCLVLRAQTNEILMFVSHEDAYYSEYIVMKEAFEASGYNVDVRNASGSQTSMYMVPSDATILTTANSLSNSSYTEFTSQYQDMFGVSWNASLNDIPSLIDVDGSIQDVIDMSQYDAIVMAGGTGALAYRSDGTYNSQGSGARLISNTVVQSASEKLSELITEALADGKPVMAQCHGASILPFCKVPGTQESILKGGNATGYPGNDPGSTDSNTEDALLSLQVNYRSDDRVTISSPNVDFVDNGKGDFKIITTRDWYPQTVAYATRSILNIIESYPSIDEMNTEISVLILHGGPLNTNDCGPENSDNDVPCNYGLAPEDLPADYTHLGELLNANSINDSFMFSVDDLNIYNGSLPYIPTDQNSIETYLSDYEVVIFFKHWSLGVSNELQNALVSFADNGGGVLGLHHALYNDIRPSENKDIIVNELFGAQSHEIGWGAERSNYTVYSTNYGHFIPTFGVNLSLPSLQAPLTWDGNDPIRGSNLSHSFYQNFEVFDEIYTNMTFLDDQTFGRSVNEITPIFSNNHSSIVQSHTTGFVKLFDPSLDESIGRVSYFEIGENRENLNVNHQFGQIVRNSIVWLANNQIDEALSQNSFTKLSDNISIYPNPSNGNVRINANSIMINYIDIFDRLGRKVIHLDGLKKMEVEVDLTNFKSGVYTMKISTDNGVLDRRMVKFD